MAKGEVNRKEETPPKEPELTAAIVKELKENSVERIADVVQAIDTWQSESVSMLMRR